MVIMDWCPDEKATWQVLADVQNNMYSFQSDQCSTTYTFMETRNINPNDNISDVTWSSGHCTSS